jgi:hypothetical protein
MIRKVSIASACLLVVAIGCDSEFRFDDLADGGIGGTTDAGPGGDAANADGSISPENGCQIDADCKLPTLHCDTPSGSCVECTNDSNCSAPRPRCDVALHRCVACGVDGDCQGDAGAKCDVSTRHCVTTCSSPFSDDCPSDEPVCDTSRGQCYRCTSNVECTFSDTDRLCQVSNGLCVACLSDADCGGATPRCDPVGGECVACVDSDDCSGATPLCDPTSLTCVAK